MKFPGNGVLKLETFIPPPVKVVVIPHLHLGYSSMALALLTFSRIVIVDAGRSTDSLSSSVSIHE